MARALELFRDLTLRLRALITPHRAERDLQDELAFHLEHEARKLIEHGVPPDQAMARARARFGSAAAVADGCRDQRGTAFVDNTIRDIRFALRSFRRAPLVAFTIGATVAVGLGVVAVLFTILNTFLFRLDAVPDVDQMYAVERVGPEGGEPSLFPRPTFDAVCQETSVFTDVYAAMSDVGLRVDARVMTATLVTGNFFRVVSVGPVLGRAIAAADDEPGANGVVVLSDRGWSRHFNRDPQVLGQTLTVGGAPFQIVGVMPPGFRGLEVKSPDFWAPLTHLALFRPAERGRENAVGLQIVGRLEPELTREQARAQLAAWHSNRRAGASGVRAETVVLSPRRGTVQRPMEAAAIFAPLFFAFGLVLLIGCANVANLLLARGLARQREIGIRLSLGASRLRIVRQLMTESWLISLAAAAGGYVISRFTLEAMFHWAVRTMPVDLGEPNLDMTVPAADWRVAVFLIVAAMGATAFFALMPALQATRIDPMQTLRGQVLSTARPGRARNTLIGIQVFASALLLICAAIFLRSAIASSRFDPGFRTVDTLVVDVLDESRRAAMVQAIAAEPGVVSHAAVRPGMLAWPFQAFATVGARRIPVAYKLVSPEYFDLFDVPLVRGRSFTPAERDGNHGVVIVSESTARLLWPNRSGVGETFRIEEDPGAAAQLSGSSEPAARLVTVVGVSRDVAGFRMNDMEQAGLFLPTSVAAPHTSIAARVNHDADTARRTLLERLVKVDPNMGMVLTMRTLARLETFFLQIAFWVSLALGGLALLLTVSGLFSVLSYLVEQRNKEIGVRMALGASSSQVTRLILNQTTRPVAYGLLAGVGLTASLATILLAMPAGAIVSTIVRVADPIAYVAGVLTIVVASLLAACIPARRAARLDPMRTLRQE